MSAHNRVFMVLSFAEGFEGETWKSYCEKLPGMLIRFKWWVLVVGDVSVLGAAPGRRSYQGCLAA